MTGLLTVQDAFHRSGECFANRDFAGAGRLLAAVVAVRPDLSAAWANLSVVLYNLAAERINAGDPAAAAPLLRTVLSIDPAFPPARGTLAMLLVRQAADACARGEPAEAEGLAAKAAGLDPDRPELGPLHGDILFRRALGLLDGGQGGGQGGGLGGGDPAAALPMVAHALAAGHAGSAAAPAVRDRLFALGKDLVLGKRFAEALRYYDAALSLAPDDLEIHYYRMFAHLWLRDYRRAWDPEIWREVYRRNSPRLWNGRDGAGSLLLLHRNGVGDFLQFVPYIAEVAPLFDRIDIHVEKRLRPLTSSPFIELFGDPAVAGKIRFVGTARVEDYDAYCELMGLAMATGIPPTALRTRAPYVRVDEALTAAWRQVVDTSAGLRRLRVGVIWSSGGKANSRSVGLDNLLPLIAGRPDVLFCGLQNDGSKADLWAADLPPNFTDLGLHDFASTAAVMRSVDLVIAPDGGLAHLAAALGVPTWLLVADWCDWRWHTDGEASDWYPAVNILRQHRAGDWSAPLAELAGRLDRRQDASDRRQDAVPFAGCPR